ncbi:hypothetical protein GE061_014699 [Apolygus lucorum]|uniref:Uncharacterized protein n=1 Tax=Apolygus lucorum TaxID=248454 RepID=A0A8S9XLN9_APOLU|nr:hypothetical protein GE061_014699 [Apolygus lucorum]
MIWRPLGLYHTLEIWLECLYKTFGSQSRITMSQEFNNLFNLEGAVLNADQASASTSSGQTSSGSGRNTNMVWDSEACCALVMHNIDRYEEYYLNVNSQKDLLAVRNFQSFLDIFGVERPPTGPPPVIDLTTTTTTDLPHTTVIVSPIIDLRTPISSPSEHQQQQTSSPNIIDLRTPISSPSEQQQQQTSSPLVFSEDEEVPPTPQTSPIPMIYDYSSDEREERVERRRKLFERFK